MADLTPTVPDHDGPRTWNYRVIRHPDGSLAIHEVHYDASGTPVAMTQNPVSFGVTEEETVDDLVRSLERALKNAREQPILDASLFAAP